MELDGNIVPPGFRVQNSGKRHKGHKGHKGHKFENPEP